MSQGNMLMKKLLITTSEMMNESTIDSIGNFFSHPPEYEQTWTGEEREVGKLKLSFPITEGLTFKRDVSVETNAIIVQKLSFKENQFHFQNTTGLLKGITEKSRFFIPCEFQIGAVIDYPIPSGVSVIYTGHGTYTTTVIANRADSPPASEVNPLTELFRCEASRHNWTNSKMLNHLDKIQDQEQFTGGPPILGNSPTEYKLKFPRTLIAVPFGMKTIITASSQMRFGKVDKPNIPYGGKKVKVGIVRPLMSDLKHYLGALHQLTHLVKQTGYQIETYSDYKSNQLDLPHILAQSAD